MPSLLRNWAVGPVRGVKSTDSPHFYRRAVGDGCLENERCRSIAPFKASRHARRAVERVLAGFDTSQVLYTVHDLVEEPNAGAADHVTFTPTLVRRFPAPRVWLLGGIRDPLIVTDLLRSCGVDSRGVTRT